MMRGWVSITVAAMVASVAGLGALGCESTTRTGTRITLNAGRASEVFFPGDVRTVHAAAEAAVGELGFTLGRSQADVTEGIVRATTAGGDPVAVFVDRDDERYVKATVLIGLPGLGDEARQRLVLEAMEASLAGER
ncbi:MAG: DUF3568 family protein [Planctomycetota bacterium]